MLRHLLKLIWKRKSRNLMLSAEILLAFLIVFAIAAFAARNYQLYHLPLGFDHRALWSVTLRPSDNAPIDPASGIYTQLRGSLQSLPEVEQLAFLTFSPYRTARMSGTVALPDGSRAQNSHLQLVSDDLAALAGVKLVEGRGFSAADDGAAMTPVLINRRMAHNLFPGRSALGQLYVEVNPNKAEEKSFRVVGVVEDFRSHGEFMAPVNYVLKRFSPLSDKDGPETVLLKVRPGTERAFEARLERQLKLLRNDWHYEIKPLGEMREDRLRSSMIPLAILSVVGAFLLAMVAFGLFGVLWQNTSQRIPEIGLRRALGASAAAIYRQIMAEQLLLSSLAMLAGLALLVQLPLTGALGESLNWQVFLAAAGLSMLLIYLLSLLCSLYPGWRASRLHPAAALHYE
ncbi:ABC transporter permease [Pseudoduganella violacea]|uniref:Putative ABC transport system permease protein n=1 Tax=Pseudoduganella violacea TaxID=1715466 RepID=A0A7W5BF46_9BURK|nr:FtsX-like permease family protein [Pseudoduganella violacea]MBB3122037.1 putative ABC transport system permease protein [Pseudoduganella violacea]